MKARAVSIATTAGLAVVVFLVGALGHSGDPEIPEPVTRGASADSFLFPSSGPDTLGAAIASLEDRVDAVPDDWEASAALGTAYVQQARITSDPSAYPLAWTALRRSLALRPRGNAGALVGLGRPTPGEPGIRATGGAVPVTRARGHSRRSLRGGR